MPNRETIAFVCRHGTRLERCAACQPSRPHEAFAENIGEIIERARPRLMWLARMAGIGPDEAEDVVQETCIEAWRHLEQLREPERFAAWLDGICRNICKRHFRAQTTTPQANSLPTSAGEAEALAFDLPDPLAIDPAEDLERQDRQMLLDRALSYLSASTRELIELCYLAELPQREVAERLEMSLGGLELKLHRARQQLRRILHSELRLDAQAFGLRLHDDEAMGWQETRQWCWLCGKRRLRGIFERRPSGRSALRLRCPACSAHPQWDVSNSGDWPGVGPMHSFRPAIKRMMQSAADFYTAVLQQRRCSVCQSLIRFQVIDPNSLKAPSSPYDRLPPRDLYLRVDCPCCGIYLANLITALFSNPGMYHFLLDRPRVRYEPATRAVYAGQDALCWRLTDLNTSEILTIMAHPETLQVMATIQE